MPITSDNYHKGEEYIMSPIRKVVHVYRWLGSAPVEGSEVNIYTYEDAHEE